ETITYTFTVTNEGNVSLSDIVVTDPLIAGITFVDGDTDGDGELDVTETWTYTADYAITQDDIDAGQVTNQATVAGTDTNDNPLSDLSDDTSVLEDDPTVTGVCQDAAIAIIKVGVLNDEDADGCSDVDETITYTFTVTNEGNVSLSDIVVTDPLIAGITFVDGDTDGDGELDVTETWTYTADYAITQDDIDAGQVTNQATVAGTDTNDNPVSDLSDDDSVLENDPTITEICQGDPNDAIAIIKVGVFNDEDADGCSDVDETITYTFTVTNEGNVSLSDIVVTDPLIAGITFVDGDTDGDGELDVTETWTYTADYAITQDDIDAGQVTNQATVAGTDTNDNPVSDLSDDTSVLEDDPTVTGVCQDAAIAIIKVGVFNDEDADGCSDVDETITYTFTVTNEGNVSLSDIVVTDPLIAGITFVDGDTDGDGELDVTETWTYTADYAITQDDIDAGQVTNQATVAGTDTNDNPVSDLSDDTSVLEDDPTVTGVCQDAAIAIIKVGVFNDEDADGCSDVGETITYTFTVTNEGNVSLSDIVVTDPLIAGITFVDGDTDGDGELDVDETWTYTAEYTITQDDIDAGAVLNQATVEGTDTNGDIVSDLSDDDSTVEDDITTTELCQGASIALIKTGIFNDENGDGIAQVGETISYTFTVINNGNVTVTNIVITDPLTGLVLNGGPIASLEPGEVDNTTYTGEYTITQADIDAGEVVNQALATGQDPNGDDVSDDSDDDSPIEDDTTITILPQGSSISLIKTGVLNDENGDGFAQVGETITYTFIVTNTGNVTVTNITIDDPLPGLELNGGPIAELQPGEVDSTTFTGVYVITEEDLLNGEVVNQAIATGQDPNGDDVIDISDDDTNLEDDETVTTLPQGSLELEKTGAIVDLNGDEFTQEGELIQYTFKVTNTGNVPLFNITIDDPLVTVEGGPIDLLPGEMDSTTFTATYILTEEDIDALIVINQATVTGEDEDGNVVTDLSDDPTEIADVDVEGDGDPDDPTVTIITGVLNEEDVEVFNGVTPDGDNSNDIFIIRGIDRFPDNTVQIFNRWGVEVYFREGYLNDTDAFDGTSQARATLNKGKELPVGTYYYILRFVNDDGETRQQAGYLYLNR
ncbi:DUF7507 domain-containing protein, partial [Dokdonia pacifica]